MKKSCVLTRTFSCDPGRVWLYLSNPTMNHWRKDVTDAENSADGMQVTEIGPDGSRTEITFTDKEKPRRMTGSFVHGKLRGSFTVILLGGGDSTSLECTFEVEGIGLFTKPQKLLEGHLDMLAQALGA